MDTDTHTYIVAGTQGEADAWAAAQIPPITNYWLINRTKSRGRLIGRGDRVVLIGRIELDDLYLMIGNIKPGEKNDIKIEAVDCEVNA